MTTNIEPTEQDHTDAICVEEGRTFKDEQEYQAHLYAQLMQENDDLTRALNIMEDEVKSLTTMNKERLKANEPNVVRNWLDKWWKAYILRPVNFNYDVGTWLMAMEQAEHEHGLATLSYKEMYAFIEAIA